MTRSIAPPSAARFGSCGWPRFWRLPLPGAFGPGSSACLDPLRWAMLVSRGINSTHLVATMCNGLQPEDGPRPCQEALLIAAHGSRDEAGVEEFWNFADAWRRLRPDRLQAAGFLEFAQPTIGDAIDELVDRGATRIVVVPAMLMAAGHVKNDVPSEVQESRLRHPAVTFQMARALDIHPAILELCQIRYRETIAPLPDVPASRTLLLLVGRGTTDPDANANIARVSRFLWESYEVGWATVAFSGVTGPNVDQALSLCRRLGFDRIVVQPYFLFDGILLKRIRDTAARHAALDPSVEIVTVPHLRATCSCSRRSRTARPRGGSRHSAHELRPL